MCVSRGSYIYLFSYTNTMSNTYYGFCPLPTATQIIVYAYVHDVHNHWESNSSRWTKRQSVLYKLPIISLFSPRVRPSVDFAVGYALSTFLCFRPTSSVLCSLAVIGNHLFEKLRSWMSSVCLTCNYSKN